MKGFVIGRKGMLSSWKLLWSVQLREMCAQELREMLEFERLSRAMRCTMQSATVEVQTNVVRHHVFVGNDRYPEI